MCFVSRGDLSDHLLGVLDLLRGAGHRARRQGREFRAQPRSSLFQGRVLHQRHPRRTGHRLPPRPSAPSHASHRCARRRQVGACLLGRGARGDGRPARRGAPPLRSRGDRRRHQRRLLQPQRDPGAHAALDRLAQLHDQPGLVRGLSRGQRAHHRPRHHARRGHRQHALRADRGAQPQRRRSRRVGRPQGRQEARRENDRDRSQAHAGGADGRPLAGTACRHRRRARAGHDAGADRGGALRQGLRRALVPWLRRAGRAGCPIYACGRC